MADLAERARLNGNREQADRLLLAAWVDHDAPKAGDSSEEIPGGMACGR
jgi:hypothetical protein